MAKRKVDPGEWLTSTVEAGTAPWVLAASALLFLLFSILSTVPLASQYIKDNFAPLVLVGLAEVMVVLFVIRQKTVRLADIAQGLRNDSFLLRPPASINNELLDIVEQMDGGEIQLICYGSNRFGKVLDRILSEHMDISVGLVVADPAIALHSADAEAIKELLDDCSASQHVKVSTCGVLPTIRAALVKDRRGKTIWVSVSPYLIHKHSRAMKSETLAPVLRATQSNAQALETLAVFVSKEFSRLRALAK